MTHNPFVEITKDTTTLYASDQDVFLFLIDDTPPIEAGRLPSGDPDLYFRGFYCWNSEVGSKTLGMQKALMQMNLHLHHVVSDRSESTSIQRGRALSPTLMQGVTCCHDSPPGRLNGIIFNSDIILYTSC